MLRSWLLLSGVILMLLLTGCGGGDSGEKVVSGEIKIEAGEFYFKPDSITVKADAPVKFVVINVGKIEHEFVFKEPMVIAAEHAKEHERMEHISAGSSQTMEMPFEPGTYTFVCGLPGHAEAGMKGKLTVVTSAGTGR